MKAAAPTVATAAAKPAAPARAPERPPERPPLLLRECACGSHAGPCESCKRKHPPLPRAAAGHDLASLAVEAPPVSMPRDPVEREADRMASAALARHPSHGSAVLRRQPARAPDLPSGHAHLASPGGAGRPLSDDVRADLEPRFGHDFSRVRIHTGPEAEAAARSIDAHAYAAGEHLVFAPGRYAPGTQEGRRLLAHELAHVVQGASGRLARDAILRQACGHDGPSNPGCGGAGNIRVEDVASGAASILQFDRLIVEEGLAWNFGGQWAIQVQSPANPVKNGADRGFVDGMRVTAGAALSAEVVEVKSASTSFRGGCALASREVAGYVQVLSALRVPFLAISNFAARGGGLRYPPGSRLPTPVEAALRQAGVDLTNPLTAEAWKFYQSLQARLNTTFTTAFTDLTVSPFAGGAPGRRYDAGRPIGVVCPKRRGVQRTGYRRFHFMVNGRGGVSYRCTTDCFESEEERERAVRELPVPEHAPEHLRNRQRLVGDPEGEPVGDPPRPQEDITTPVVVTLTALASLAATAELYRRARTAAERRALQAAATKAAERIATRGIPTVAERLDGVNLAERTFRNRITLAQNQLDDVARTVPKGALARRLGPKAAEKFARVGSRAFIVLAVVFAARDAHAAIDHVQRGGELELGFSLDETSLSGTTQIENQGMEDAPRPDVSGDTRLRDTRVEMDVRRLPDLSGRAEIDADRVTIRGRVDEGASIQLDFRLRVRNSTIIVRNAGTIRDGRMVVSGESEITDSQIEIDLPPGADAATGDGRPVIIHGARMRVTQTGGGGGATGGQTTGGQGAGGQGTGTPSADAQGGQTQTTPTPTPAQTQGQAGGTGTAGATPAGADRRALLAEIRADPILQRVYDRLRARQGALVTDEALRALLDLRPLLLRHESRLDAILAEATEGSGEGDALQQTITPLRQRLLAAESQVQAALDQAAGGGTPGGTTGGEGQSVTGQVREIPFTQVRQSLTISDREAEGITTPPASVTMTAVWTVSGGGVTLRYRIPLALRLVRQLPAERGYRWAALYEYDTPAGVYQTEQRDRPIRFTGSGVHELPIGLYRPAERSGAASGGSP